MIFFVFSGSAITAVIISWLFLSKFWLSNYKKHYISGENSVSLVATKYGGETLTASADEHCYKLIEVKNLKNILFICSRNKWRSLTAETIYKNSSQWIVKSAGTENSARVKINSKLLNWAELIFVMEKHHKEKLLLNFPEETKNAEIIILEIPDIYKFMDEELIEEIKASVSAYL